MATSRRWPNIDARPAIDRCSRMRVNERATFPGLSLLLVGLMLFGACSLPGVKPASNVAVARGEKQNLKELRIAMGRLEPFFLPMGKPAKYDWLASHNEPGQTFEEYLDSRPTKPTADRNKIYVLPLGNFSAVQQKVIKTASGYLAAFYGLSVKELSPQNLRTDLKIKDHRRNRVTGIDQIRTGYILDAVLKPILPTDAAALIAFIAKDLYPDTSMNYVFGQASLENRVGVWSLARLDDNADQATFLRRTIKIAAHETGHMFSMRHCTKYECLMSGTNHLSETDRRPIDACPECTTKIAWFTNTDLRERYKRLEEFCKKNGLTKDADEFRRKADASI